VDFFCLQGALGSESVTAALGRWFKASAIDLTAVGRMRIKTSSRSASTTIFSAIHELVSFYAGRKLDVVGEEPCGTPAAATMSARSPVRNLFRWIRRSRGQAGSRGETVFGIVRYDR